jgi:Fur family peroxide stress response transcriptional regulator
MTQTLMRETGFSISRHRLDFFGICPDCQDR